MSAPLKGFDYSNHYLLVHPRDIADTNRQNMFTGIITATSKVSHTSKTAEGLVMTLVKPDDWSDLSLGESIATDGVCLSVASIRENEYDCLLVPETLNKTVFGQYIPEAVNLERSLTLNDRLSGHFVQGHIDDVGIVSSIAQDDGYRLYIQYDRAKRDLVILKGSVTINGVSLTIADLNADALAVALIPLTLQQTTLGSLKVGDKVNLEFDMIGKYIVRHIHKETG